MAIILNRSDLASNSIRSSALDILEAGLEAIDTEKALTKTFSEKEIFKNLKSFNRVFFIGIGKCSFEGAKIIESNFGKFIHSGIAIDVKQEKPEGLKKIKALTGTHPYPSVTNLSAVSDVLNMVEDLNENDLVINLISGGGSSLFCAPSESLVKLDDESGVKSLMEITKSLTHKGADIFELNTVRKHLSKVQGGNLAKILFFPAKVVSLIFSDVLGNDISMVASGPTVPDQTTKADAISVLKKYGIFENYFQSEDDILETPKDQKFFENVSNFLIVSNRDALAAMKLKAEELGFYASIETERLSGDAEELGKKMALAEVQRKSCLLFGGETTVKINQKHGSGGRNQTMALAALPYMQPNSVFVCAASDGWDDTEYAGALADRDLMQVAENLKLNISEYLQNSDSFNFFKKVNGGIYTGRLGSNVSDLCIMLYE